MSHSQNFVSGVACTTLAVLIPAMAASGQKIYTDYDHKVDFNHYHTFSVYRVHAGDQILENRLRDNIVQSLVRHGYQQVPQGGDLAITAIGGVRNQREYNTFYNGFGPGWGWGGWGGPPYTTITDYPVGTTAIDLYDSKTHQLVFRGYGSDKESKNSEKNAVKSQKMIDKIFDRLPESPGKR